MRRQFERSFLIRLAAPYLACRWQVMGKSVDTPWQKGHGQLAFSMLGMMDYRAEMKLECQDLLGNFYGIAVTPSAGR